MLNALSRADEADRALLRTLPFDETLPAEERIARVKAIYDKYDVPHLINQQISTRFDRALAILDTLSIEPERVEHLKVFARSLMKRKK